MFSTKYSVFLFVTSYVGAGLLPSIPSSVVL